MKQSAGAWLLALLLLPGATPGVATAAQPAGYRVYVTNERSGTLTVIDGPTRKIIGTLQLGKRPRGAKLSPDGRELYVALSGSPIAGPGVDESKLPPPDKAADGIGVVDLAKLELTRVIRGVSDPEQLALSHDGKQLFIASEDTGAAIVLDVKDGRRLASLAVGGEPEGMTTSPDGKVVYVTSEQDHRVSVIDVATSKVVRQLQVGQRPRFTAFSADGRRAYVSCENDSSISVIDAIQHVATGSIKLEGGPLMRPVGLVVSPDGSRLYAATGRGGLVVTIDTATGKALGQVAVGPRPWGIALSPDGKTIFTANGSSNDVSVVDVATLKVVSKLPVGDGPWGAVAAVWPPSRR
jgi:YVTN family beta-propeller protein